MRRAPGRRSLSLRDRAYEEIKHRIITVSYPPGSYLNEAQLCAELKIGRTPVHQALERLMRDGMIQVIPRKGTIVRPVSLNDVLDVVETRLIIEPRCAALAAERITAKELAKARKLLDKAATVVNLRDQERLMRLDREFHGVVCRAARNQAMADILQHLHERLLRFWFITFTDSGRPLRVQGEHEAMLAALAARNPEAAAARTRDHILAFRDEFARRL